MSKKILIVEDEKDLADMLKFRLENNGYRVVIANDGENGLDKARSEKPDLILLDVMMPKMDGYEVLESLKKTEILKSIPVIMLTVKDRTEDIQRATRAGAIDYTIKPFHGPTLLDKIKRVIGE